VNVASHTTQCFGGVCVVSLVGEIDMLTADAVEKWLCDAAHADRPRRLEADLGGVDFIDSSGVRALLRAREELVELNVQFVVTNPNAMIERILRVLGLLDHLTKPSLMKPL
jgi:anti-sigma B factor antagonist